VRVSAGGPPSGIVTFLFTDIEGSTRRWEADAESMRVALVAHDEVLRSEIEAHGGFLFSHTGDGVVAAFASPKAAVDMAVAAQRKLELPVRMGIATGEAEIRNSDYFGTVLNRAARVMASGHGGQILVADSTATLLSGLELVNLGARRLRDLRSRSQYFSCARRGCGRTSRRYGHSRRIRGTSGPRPPVWWAASPRSPRSMRSCEIIGW
jgi:class 3 adenylate cyclase